MSTYNTGNPVPSIDPRDLDDNATVFDNLANGNNASYPDRLGVARKSWYQMELDAAALVSPNVAALASLTLSANKGLYATGAATLATYDLTSLGRTLGGIANAVAGRAALSAAASGVNADITSITGLTTALSIAQGGTGSTTAATARTSLGAAASGANTDITSITGSAASLTASRSISTTGDATWTVNFDGTSNATAAITLAASGISAGSYQQVTVDTKGRVTAGVAVAAFTNFTLQNSWVVVSGARAAYRKVADMVQIEVQIQSGTATDGAVFATLPAGFRPLFPIVIPCVSPPNTPLSTTVPGPRIQINTNGTMACFNCSSGVGLFFTTMIPTI